jgi:hypothetical protein
MDDDRGIQCQDMLGYLPAAAAVWLCGNGGIAMLVAPSKECPRAPLMRGEALDP